MSSQPTLYSIRITGAITELQPGLWRARTGPWALTAYGATAQEAEQKIRHMVEVYLLAVAARKPLLAELERAGVPVEQFPASSASGVQAGTPSIERALPLARESDISYTFETSTLLAA